MIKSDRNGNQYKRLVLIIVGTFLGIVFLYLAFRGISWTEFVSGLKEIKPAFLFPAALLVLLIQLVRALRFGVILNPICPLGFKDLWDVLNVWGAANMIMPARLGEFVRPYLLQRKGAPFSSSFGAVMVERFFDLTGLLLLLALVLWKTPGVPKAYSSLGLALLVALSGGYAIVLLLLARREASHAIVARVFSVLPQRAAEFLNGVFHRLLDGLGIMASFKQAAVIFVYSVVLWMLFSLLTYTFLLAFEIQVPFLVAVTIQVLLCFGVALPTAPGFIGTFHAAGRYALALFGVQAVVAVSFATVYHLFTLLASLMLGAISYLTSDFRFDHEVFHAQSKSVYGPAVK